MQVPLQHIFNYNNFFLHDLKEKTLFTTNWIKRMDMELVIKTIIGTKIIVPRSMFFGA